MTSTPVIASASTIASACASAPSPVLGPPPSGTAAFRRVVWSGTIPLSVSLDAADLPAGSDSSVDSTYLVVPRISYLPLLLDKVRTHLLELILDPTALALLKDKEWWFEADGQPLKWHWPIGLLYDYHTRNPASTSLGPLSVSPSPPPPLLPWKLRLHLSKPPLDRLHTGPSLDTCKTSFMSMLKEADFVRYGSTKRVVNLRRQEQDALWQGLVDHDFDAYWAVAHKLLPVDTPAHSQSQSQAQASETPVRSVPMRILLPDSAPVVQEPVSPLLADGRPATLGTVLSGLLPLLFPPQPSFSSHQPPSPPLAYAVVQGVRVPLDAEIGWLGSTMISPDGWLGVLVGLLQTGEAA